MRLRASISPKITGGACPRPPRDEVVPHPKRSAPPLLYTFSPLLDAQGRMNLVPPKQSCYVPRLHNRPPLNLEKLVYAPPPRYISGCSPAYSLAYKCLWLVHVQHMNILYIIT